MLAGGGAKSSLESVLQRVASDGDDDVIGSRLFSSTFHDSAPHPRGTTWREQSCCPGSFEVPPRIPGFFQTVISELDLKTMFGLRSQIKCNILNQLNSPLRTVRARLHTLPQQKYEPIRSTVRPRPVSDTPEDRNKASHLLLLSLSASTLLPHIRCCRVIFQVFFPPSPSFSKVGG